MLSLLEVRIALAARAAARGIINSCLWPAKLTEIKPQSIKLPVLRCLPC